MDGDHLVNLSALRHVCTAYNIVHPNTADFVVNFTVLSPWQAQFASRPARAKLFA